jgi:hypothetical protein
MKLSDKTVNLLKNFSNINQSILFKEGSKLRTMSVMKNILAEAEVVEDLFPIPSHQNPDLDFTNDNHVVIKEGRMRSKYFFADPSVIVTPPDKNLDLPSEDVSFELNTQQLDRLLKAAAIYQLPDLAVVGENGVVRIVVRDKKNDTSNDFAITVGETNDEFNFNFKVENIKIIPGTYEVVVSQKLLSRFKCKDYDLTYFIALEPDSSFG